VIETATFVCSICNEPSTEICVYCTKDTCRNHRCERCKRCSDCCECEVRLVEPSRETADHNMPEVAPEPVAEPAVAADIPAPPQASEEPDLNVPAVENVIPEPIEPAHPE